MYGLIKKYEGCRLTAYKCPAGVWTIGWGSTTYKDGKPVKQGDKITQAVADDLLDWYVKTKIKIPAGLTKQQTEALQSLIYNIGQGAFDRSSLKKAIIAQDWKAVYKNWDWVTGGGKFLKGLAKRRAEELLMFFA
ncbi:MAG: lysozyme [Alphaproteobacteria bacterium]|nr:lysozyme [Alphaproteobacteria bacterium]MBR5354580.1 lysozyme [Alphaproteobacteria bacterium]